MSFAVAALWTSHIADQFSRRDWLPAAAHEVRTVLVDECHRPTDQHFSYPTRRTQRHCVAVGCARRPRARCGGRDPLLPSPPPARPARGSARHPLPSHGPESHKRHGVPPRIGDHRASDATHPKPSSPRATQELVGSSSWDAPTIAQDKCGIESATPLHPSSVTTPREVRYMARNNRKKPARTLLEKRQAKQEKRAAQADRRRKRERLQQSA